MTPEWSAVDALQDEHARLRAASEHVARAVAELVRAAQQVGDHAAAVALRDSIEGLQLTQAQLATAAERAFSQAELARRSARQAAFQRQFDAATSATIQRELDERREASAELEERRGASD